VDFPGNFPGNYPGDFRGHFRGDFRGTGPGRGTPLLGQLVLDAADEDRGLHAESLARQRAAAPAAASLPVNTSPRLGMLRMNATTDEADMRESEP